MVQTPVRTSTSTKPKATRTSRGRKSGKKAESTQEPVDVYALPELKEALKWADEVRAKAETVIARETSKIPSGVRDWLRSLVNAGSLPRRQFEMVSAWNGVGARGRKPGEGDYYAINQTMKALALLPPEGADLERWWVTHAMSDMTERDDSKISLVPLYPNHYKAYSESAVGLQDALRNAMIRLLPHIPSPVVTYELIKTRRARLSSEPQVIALSEVVTVLTRMEWMRDVVQGTDADHTPKRIEVESVREALVAAGVDEFVTDCGLVRSAGQMRGIIAEFGNRARGCSRCGNWFTVSEDRVKYDWYNRCPGCSKGWMPGIFTGGYESSERALVSAVDGWTNGTISLAPKIAIAEGTTLGHARQLLQGTEQKVAEAIDGLKACPLASECDTLCGRLQADGRRAIPLAPENGRYASCHIYGFMEMAKGAEGEAREEIAKAWMRQINEGIDAATKKQAGMMPEAESATDAAQETAQNVSVQQSLF